MEQHFNLSDDELESQFKDCTLDPAVFTHKEHIRLAWIHISKYGLVEAEKNIITQLKKYVIAINEVDIYNETLAVAAVKIVNHFMQRTNSNKFQDLIDEHPRLVTNFKGLIASHYGFDIYNNDKAKKAYLEPDLIPFN